MHEAWASSVHKTVPWCFSPPPRPCSIPEPRPEPKTMDKVWIPCRPDLAVPCLSYLSLLDPREPTTSLNKTSCPSLIHSASLLPSPVYPSLLTGESSYTYRLLPQVFFCTIRPPVLLLSTLASTHNSHRRRAPSYTPTNSPSTSIIL